MSAEEVRHEFADEHAETARQQVFSERAEAAEQVRREVRAWEAHTRAAHVQRAAGVAAAAATRREERDQLREAALEATWRVREEQGEQGRAEREQLAAIDDVQRRHAASAKQVTFGPGPEPNPNRDPPP